MNTIPFSRSGGFSFTQVLIAVAIIGVVTTAAFRMMTDTPERVRASKLESDVKSVNAAIQVYESFGGSIPGDATAADVLAKLKTRGNEVFRKQTAGVSGSLLDRRLAIEPISQADANAGKPRAVWNSETRRFELSTEGTGGIAKFCLSAEAAEVEVVLEDRTPNLKLAVTDNWVWDYQDVLPGGGTSPTWSPTSLLPDGQGGAPPGGFTPPGGGGDPGDGATPLDAPLFSIASGEFPVTDFDLFLTLSNPPSNPAGESRILYSKNSGPWVVYGGEVMTVEPDDAFQAYTESLSEDYSDSSEAGESYTASTVQLDAPTIIASADKFDFEGDADISVEITNPNDAAVSEVRYKLEGATDWTTYGGTITLNVMDYTDGITVTAQAFATADYYENSSSADKSIEAPDPTQLDEPTIMTSAARFDYDDNQNVTVTISNPNDTSEATIEYRVNDGGWATYSGPFQLNVMDHQTSPAMIQAKAVPMVSYRIESAVVGATVFEPDPLFSISGSSDGVYANPTGPGVDDGYVYTGDGGHTFYWGNPVNGSNPSSLTFAGANFDEVSQGEKFLLGAIDYYNGTIYSGTGADSVQLLVDLAFDDGGGTNLLQFSIDLLNTVNTSDAWESADYVKLQDVYSYTTTPISDRNYALKVEFGETTEEGFSTLDEFHVLEGETATGNLYGTLWIQLD